MLKTYATLHLKSIVSRKVSVFGGIEVRNIISCHYFASNPFFSSFSFSHQLIENSSPAKRNLQGISRPLFTRLPLITALPEFDARLRNFVTQIAINFGTCPMTLISSLISFECEDRFLVANSRCRISRWPGLSLFFPLLWKLSRTTLFSSHLYSWVALSRNKKIIQKPFTA